MAHHNFDMPDFIDDPSKKLREETMRRLREEMERIGQPLGAMGRYPAGRYAPHDEGEIRFAIAADVQARKVLVDFGKPVHSLGMTVEEAEGLIESLQAKVWEIRGIK